MKTRINDGLFGFGVTAALVLVMVSSAMSTAWSQMENQVTNENTSTDNCGLLKPVYRR
jgi:hypothetical protein